MSHLHPTAPGGPIRRPFAYAHHEDTYVLPPAPNRIRELRQARLWTQRQLAGRARVALRTVCNVERGHVCRMDTKRKLLGALGLEHTEWMNVWPCEVSQRAL